MGKGQCTHYAQSHPTIKEKKIVYITYIYIYIFLDPQDEDGGTNFILRIKEQETRLTLQEHDDDDNISEQ